MTGWEQTLESEAGEVAAVHRTVSRPELLDENGDTRFRDFLHTMFAFSSRLQEARSRFGAHIGLSPTQYMILIAVAKLVDEEPGIAQVSGHLHLSGAFMTIEVNKLVKARLVEKSPHTGDGRRIVLRVTKEGHARLARLAAFQRPVNDALFASLDADEFLTLHRLMRRLLADSESALALADYVEERLAHHQSNEVDFPQPMPPLDLPRSSGELF